MYVCVRSRQDTGFVTILLPGSPGLEIRDLVTGEWRAVRGPPVPGAVVVNLGELLQHLTGQ
jgi:isopenicillin N synthase-like dioxygenase